MVNPGVDASTSNNRTKSTENTPKNAKRQPTENQLKEY